MQSRAGIGREPLWRSAVLHALRHALAVDPGVRASWHAKCLVVAGGATFVSSATFTEWAQQRNVEAAVLV